ncbi:hypothetical protein EVAR_36203_1 [Eumeta japonica]|uniref:Uncharacterized protein n=1 Tax=Eumeta variegata TaxID=151549 RepID=A0A4C1VSY7_EUMVA|nr:hypothetical protein EVAR_36203_1 [Eumeta japonica]
MTFASSLTPVVVVATFELTALTGCDDFAALEALAFCDAGASCEIDFPTVRQEGVNGDVFLDVAAADAGAAVVTKRGTGEAEVDAYGFLPDRRINTGPYVENSRGWQDFRV